MGPLRQRRPRIRDEKHLRLIRQLPCLICRRYPPSEAAHVRYGDPRYDKLPTGQREKPDDKWSLPLCASHHRTGRDAQHGTNERAWWEARGIDPLAICERLYGLSSPEAMELEIYRLLHGGDYYGSSIPANSVP